VKLNNEQPLISYIIATNKKLEKNCIYPLLTKEIGIKSELIVVHLEPDLELDFTEYSNVITIKNSQKVPLASAYNQGIGRSTGKYICFLSGNEILPKNLHKVLIKELEKNKIDIGIIPNIFLKNHEEDICSIKIKNNYFHKLFQKSLKNIINSVSVTYLSNKVFSREYILETKNFFQPDIPFFQISFIIKAFRKADIIVGLGELNIQHIINNDVTTSENKEQISKYKAVLKDNSIDILSDKNFDIRKGVDFFNLMKDYFSYFTDHNQLTGFYKLTVIVPVYNTEKYLKSCLNSLFTQKLKDIQVIAVNDGSTDDSLNILYEIAVDNSNMHIININTPSGHAGTPRNLALSIANSEYIGFVDSDDWVDTKMFYDLYSKSKTDNLDICSTSGYFRVDDKNNMSEQHINYIARKSKSDYSFLKNKFFSNIWNRIYSTKVIKENGVFFPSLYISEDFCFSAVVHYFSNNTGSVNGSYYYYRYNLPESTTDQRQGEKGLLILENFETEMDYLCIFGFSDEFLTALIQKQTDSFWYTHDRLDNLLKYSFKVKFKELMLPFEKKFDYELFDHNQRGRMKSLFSQDFNSNDIDIAMKGLDLYRLKKGIEFQLKGDYSKSVKYYDLLENDKIKNVNKFAALMLQQSIIEAKICFHNLYDFEKEYVQCKGVLLDYYSNSNKLDYKELYEHQDIVTSSDVLLSIIIPVYNSSKYLDSCLCSVLEQTYSNLEIVIVNDGSTDESVSIIKKYADIDRRIVFIDNAVPSGNPGTPRNQALKIVKGHYVTFVDSDDYVAANYYEKFFNSLQSNKEEVDIVFASGYQDYYNKDKVEKRIYNNSNFDDKLDIFYRYHESFTIWDKIYRTSFLIDNDIYLAETPAAVDVPFVFKCYIAAKKISICDSNYGYFYRRESDSSVTVNKRMKSNCQFEFDVYDQVMDWVSLSPSRTSFSPLVDFKKISSYLYTLNLISDEHKEDFYKKVRSEFLSFDKDLMIELLSRSKQHSKLGRFKKILAVPYME